jgi:rfaE bifunctional protein kinase chain/domain
MNLKQLTELTALAPDCEITVAGDFCLDKYLYIDSDLDEPSLETGLTAYQVIGKGIYPGGAGTVTNNLRGLTAKVHCVGIVGDDGEGFELLRALSDIGADISGMVTDKNRCTSTYTKPMRGKPGDYKELNRLDFKNFEPMKPDVEAKIIENIKKYAAMSKALLVLDQFVEEDCGVINSRVREAIMQISRENPDLVVYADSRAFIHLFSDVIVKCNNFEVVKSVRPGFEGEPDEKTVLECGMELFKKNNRPVFVTRGKHGITVFDKDGIHNSPAIDVPGPFDICGAGDSASSGIVLALSLGASPEDAALMGNIVASITIQQIGVTGFATPAQVIQRFKDYCM